MNQHSTIAPHPDAAGWLVAAGGLLRHLPRGAADGVTLAEFPLAGELELVTHPGWAALAERYGTRGALVNLDTGTVTPLSRADHHAGVSSYSLAFLELAGRTVLLTQTQWNRLDMFDAATGVNLTPGGEEHSIDYFHSRLVTSPSGKYFVSNGWMWHPLDVLQVYSTTDFVERRERSGVGFPGPGYNWDRPIAFVSDSRLLVSLDRAELAWYGRLRASDEPDYHDNVSPYRPFVLLDVDQLFQDPEGFVVDRVLGPEFFTQNDDGEVQGELAFDPGSGLVLATDQVQDSIAFDLEGNICRRWRGISVDAGWRYFPTRRCFARWAPEVGVEELAMAQ